ncbi:hypothetical protein GCM10022410_19320 [Amphibacillus indicireducens]|uniref:peptide-methionine (S)-S-oxide reductase n=1 Tax=Amphibacillus indicireducens TaxID=1076330 RepID=A0ABP7VTU4_9BACI
MTEIIKYSKFYPAEDYHQDFYQKNEAEYVKDRQLSGRDQFIEQNWNYFHNYKTNENSIVRDHLLN